MKEALCFFGLTGATSQWNYKSMQFNIKKHRKYKGQGNQMGAYEQMPCYRPLAGSEALHQCFHHMVIC